MYGDVKCIYKGMALQIDMERTGCVVSHFTVSLGVEVAALHAILMKGLLTSF